MSSQQRYTSSYYEQGDQEDARQAFRAEMRLIRTVLWSSGIICAVCGAFAVWVILGAIPHWIVQP